MLSVEEIFEAAWRFQLLNLSIIVLQAYVRAFAVSTTGRTVCTGTLDAVSAIANAGTEYVDLKSQFVTPVSFIASEFVTAPCFFKYQIFTLLSGKYHES